MDCGPGALHSLLAGFGIAVSYGRLREACQTDVDGTSLNALEASARGLGLDVAQLMLPADHVALRCATALPAIAVVRLPSAMPHFVVAWRRDGRWVQVMDPASGRRAVSARELPALLYIHEQAVPFAAWEQFAQAPTFRLALSERLHALGIRRRDAQRLITRADELGGRSMATLDAQARALAEANGRRAGPAGAALALAVEDPDGALAALPAEAWFARPLRPGDDPGEVLLRGAVLLRARGVADDPPDPASLPPDLAAALAEPPAQPARRLLATARAAGRVAIAPLVLAVVLLAAGTIAEAALLRGSLDDLDVRRALIVVALIALLLAAIETITAAGALAIGRRLEIGLRRALAIKLPRLPDRYLRSRPPSDLAGRAHALHELRVLPLLVTQLLAAVLETVFVAVALCVLDPAGAPLVVAATLGALGVALAVQIPLREREVRAREHASALGQCTLDGLLGVLAIRAHGAERALTAEHDERLHGWVAAARATVRARSSATFAQTACGIGLAIPVVITGFDHLDSPPERLLLVLWAVTIPVAAERVGQIALQWPALRTLALRLAEPLDAPDAAGVDGPQAAPQADRRGGAQIVFDDVTVRATGQDVLAATTLQIAPGEHVALVGLSGAGKSTLLALALGLSDPSQGRVSIDGTSLADGGARALWPHVAWVDSQVRVWNRDITANVAPFADEQRVRALLQSAELDAVAARVGDDPLGANGGLLSGGEAQRVRLARALGREDVRLAVLDEPLRGLDRDQRHRLLARARVRWRNATLLCATHDVNEALTFDRVLVLDGGAIIADGPPDALLAAPGSPLRAMLDAERALRAELDAGRGWRRLRVSQGTLHEAPRTPTGPTPPADTANAGTPDEHPLFGDPAVGPPPACAHRAAPAFVVFAGATILRYMAFAASWSVIGSAVLSDTDAGLGTWALLLAATVPLAALAEAAEGRTAIALGARLRRRTLRGALALDAGWVRREGPGRILGRAMEVDAIARLAASGGLGAVTALIELAVATVALLLSGPGRYAASALFVVLIAAAVTTAIAVRRRQAWMSARLTETEGLLEAIAGQRTRLIQGDDEIDQRQTRLREYERLGALADRPLAALAGALPRVALAAGLAAIAVAGDLSQPSEIALALGGVLLASQALRRIAAAVEALSSATLARRALTPILPPTDDTEEPDPTAAPARTAPRNTERSPLAIREVCVDRDGRRVLHDVNLELHPGDHAVLAGTSGAGKSTLALALAGLLPVEAGTIKLDTARSSDADWRSKVGLVPQHGDNHVLLAPMAFNLLMGRNWPPQPEDLEAAIAVCRELGLGPLLQRMPAGLGQVVGETGWRLSQGERARLCLARALLADHDVLILDEPLGALDPQTARTVLDVARRHAPTLVVISQE